jgi:lysophospholipase L1-like esterase
MIRSFILLTALFIATITQAQIVKWDSTHRPGNYAQRVEQFRSYTNTPGEVVFLGNSITAGTDWNELLELKNARNRGISGDITFGVLERLGEVTEGKPVKLFVLIGINDIARNIPDSVILDNYKKIIHRVRAASPSTKIYFQTLMPVNNEFTPFKNHYNKDEHIKAVNDGLKELGKKEKITIIDLHPHFLDKDAKLEKSFTGDGLHLNPAGYRKWATVLKPYLK